MNRSWHLLRDLFTKNLVLKMFSLLLAFLLWAFVSTEPETTRTLKVPLEYQNYPLKEYVLIGDSIDSVEVRLSGPSNWLRRIEAGDLAVDIDLKDCQAGSRTFPITKDKINLRAYSQKGITIGSIRPNNINLRIEKIQSKEVPVKANIVGQNEIAPGYEMASYQCQPAQVKIAGPESSVKRLNFVPTEIIDVSGCSAPLKRTVNLSLADPHIEVSNSPQIDVDVKIVSKKLQLRAAPTAKK